jgi:predicted YcjX-like family ATPase
MLESVIIYDKEQNLYNFPFKIQYNNHEEIIDFYFNSGDYSDQESMLRDRIDYCSKELFNHFMSRFERLQEICLDDSVEANNESVNTINNLLSFLLNLFNVFIKIHCNPDVTSRLSELFEELLEMFLLLEDYYTIERKTELYNWKKKFITIKSH